MGLIAKSNFFERKIHSLTGIIPIGVFLLEHLITNSFAIKGPEYYNQKIEAFQQIPFLVPIELSLIALPLAIHTILGLYYVFLAKNNVIQYKYFRNYMFYIQRITAIITFVFVIYHAYTARIGRAAAGIEISYQFMNNILSQPFFFIVYLVGLLAAAFHFTNGIYTFAISWGITLGPRSQRILQGVCTALFFIMSGVGTVELIALAG